VERGGIVDTSVNLTWLNCGGKIEVMASPAPNLLNEQQVNERLCSYDDTKVTDELYEFGSRMLSEFIDVNHQLDSKGSTLAGYSTAIVALLVSTSPFWRPVFDQWVVMVVLGAGLCAMIASAFSMKAAALYTFKWFSDDEWLHRKYLENPETMRRYRILTMHNVVSSHRNTAEEKSSYLGIAQWALTISGGLLFIALASAALKGMSMHSF
jgi:hypothetical protein